MEGTPGPSTGAGHFSNTNSNTNTSSSGSSGSRRRRQRRRSTAAANTPSSLPPLPVPPCLQNSIGLHAAESSSTSGISCGAIGNPNWLNAAEWWWRRSSYFALSLGTPAAAAAAPSTSSGGSSSSSSNSPYMDWRLWSNLPDDLIERVLTWLPVPTFFRFRTVCKRWRAIMYTRGFSEMCADVPSRGPFFLKVPRCRCRMLAVYYPAAKRWLNIPIGFLPSQVSVPAASSKGLMCFIATQYVDGYSVLLVCNPLTRCWKALPPMTTRRYPFVVALVTDRKVSAYKVVVAGDYNSFENRRTTEVYDSVTSTWKQSGPLPREEEITKNIVACNGYLFCLSRGPGNGLLAFSLQQEVWIKVRTGRMPGYSKFRHLVECNGRIIIVGKALRKQVLGLYIWHLDPPSMKWRELAKMPQLLSEQFFRTPSECFFCCSYGDQIFISRFFCDLGLLYNISHDTWQWIPDCPKIANPFILTLEPGFDAVY